MDTNEQRQASVKQVQFLETLEQRTGVKYNGTKWVASEVSDFISEHSQKKGQSGNNQDSNKFKASNPFVDGQSGKKHSNKITDKQRQFIKVLEDKTGAFFNGKTFEDAEAYIKEHRS